MVVIFTREYYDIDTKKCVKKARPRFLHKDVQKSLSFVQRECSGFSVKSLPKKKQKDLKGYLWVTSVWVGLTKTTKTRPYIIRFMLDEIFKSSFIKSATISLVIMQSQVRSKNAKNKKKQPVKLTFLLACSLLSCVDSREYFMLLQIGGPGDPHSKPSFQMSFEVECLITVN